MIQAGVFFEGAVYICKAKWWSGCVSMYQDEKFGGSVKKLWLGGLFYRVTVYALRFLSGLCIKAYRIWDKESLVNPWRFVLYEIVLCFLRFCSGLCVKAYKVWDKESLVGGSMEICVLWEIVVPIEEWYKFFEQGDNSSGRRGYNDNKNSPWLRLMI